APATFAYAAVLASAAASDVRSRARTEPAAGRAGALASSRSPERSARAREDVAARAGVAETLAVAGNAHASPVGPKGPASSGAVIPIAPSAPPAEPASYEEQVSDLQAHFDLLARRIARMAQ